MYPLLSVFLSPLSALLLDEWQVKVLIIIIMQPITIQFAVRVRKVYTPLHIYLGCVWVVIYVKYITYEGLLHNTLALDVDTVQEACIQQSA